MSERAAYHLHRVLQRTCTDKSAFPAIMPIGGAAITATWQVGPYALQITADDTTVRACLQQPGRLTRIFYLYDPQPAPFQEITAHVHLLTNRLKAHNPQWRNFYTQG